MCVDDGDGPRAVQANDCPLLNYDICPPSDHDKGRYNQDTREAVQFLDQDGTPLAPHRQHTPERVSSKRRQNLQDVGASKHTCSEPADTAGGAGGGAHTLVSAAELIQRTWSSRAHAKS